jgi:hypothetical protein
MHIEVFGHKYMRTPHTSGVPYPKLRESKNLTTKRNYIFTTPMCPALHGQEWRATHVNSTKLYLKFSNMQAQSLQISNIH